MSIQKIVFRLNLRYPNGRVHQLDYEGRERFHVGQEFEMYGRRWRVAYVGHSGRGRRDAESQLVTCLPLTEMRRPRVNGRAVDYDRLVGDLALINDLLEQIEESESASMQGTRGDLDRTRARMLELLAAFGPPSAS